MKEDNDITTDNTATVDPYTAKDPYAANDPYATSDELSAPVDANDLRIRTSYAKSKKVGAAVKKVTIITGATLAAGGIGLSVYNGLNPSSASVSNTNIVLVENAVEYSFTVKNGAKRQITFTVDCDEKNFFTLDVSTPNTYSGKTPTLPEYSVITATISATNGIDYYATLFKVTLK